MVSNVSLNSFDTSTIAQPSLKKRLGNGSISVSAQKNEINFAGGIANYITHPVLALNVLPKLKNEADKDAFVKVYSAVDLQGQADLKFLLNSGKLLSNDADDGTSTLQNLARILAEPRAKGLNSKVVLHDTLRALANPYTITQNFGKLSPQVAASIMKNAQTAQFAKAVGLETKTVSFAAKSQPNVNNPKDQLPEEYSVNASGTCVAASTEFNLADKRPAEFARYAADLSGINMSVKEQFKFDDIDTNTLNAMYWLDQFNVDYAADNFTEGFVTLKPDDAAIFRAISQSQARAKGTRSTIDVLMQSTFMQLGSASSYNSLNDIRTGGFNQSNRGLTEFEKSMTEAIVDDKGGISSVTYQQVDDNAFLVAYNKDYQSTLMEIINSLKAGFNVVIGITETDSKAQIIGGHEITVVGSEVDINGKLIFICNDTDDDKDEPIRIPAEELIPKIHHAGIPNIVLKQTPQQPVQQPIYIQKPITNTTNNVAKTAFLADKSKLNMVV
ncbi:MAG: hypothetical protein AB7V50_00875 [Vampirovibrionia bacterium]